MIHRVAHEPKPNIGTTKNESFHFITFSHHTIIFAIDANFVKESKPFKDIIIQPLYCPPYILGATYLYNQIIPIFDLISVFDSNCKPYRYTASDSILFVEVNDEIAGIGTTNVPTFREIDTFDKMDSNLKFPFGTYIKGIKHHDKNILLNLDIQKILFHPFLLTEFKSQQPMEIKKDD